MFCKKCGKEVEDDSIFCKYCGEDLSSSKNYYKINENKVSIDANVLLSSKSAKYLKFFFKKYSRATWLYIIWFLLNCTFWIIAIMDDDYHYAQDSFIISTDGFSIGYYDSTEFLLFTLIIPGLLLGIGKVCGNKLYKIATRLCSILRNNKAVQWFAAIFILCISILIAYYYYQFLGLAIVFATTAICSLVLFIYRKIISKGKEIIYLVLSFTAFGTSWFSFVQHKQCELEKESLPLYRKICQYPTVGDCKKYIQLYSKTSNATSVYNRWFNKLIGESKNFKFFSSDVRFDGSTITPLQKLVELAEFAHDYHNDIIESKATTAIETISDSLYDIACEYKQVNKWRKFCAFVPKGFKRDSENQLEEACTFLYNRCYNEKSLESWETFLKVVPDSLQRDAYEQIKSVYSYMYKEATMKNSIKTWIHYIDSVPEEELRDSRDKLKSLCDSMYNAAKSHDNYKEWSKYIKTVPYEYLKDSKERLHNCIWRNQDTAWEYVCDKDTKAMYEKYLAHFPHGKHSTVARSRIRAKYYSLFYY